MYRILIALVLITTFSFSSNYEENELYIKFDSGLSNQKVLEIQSDIHDIISIQSLTPIYRNTIIDKASARTLSAASRRNLSRIYRVRYDLRIDSRIAAAKLSSISGIEYAEAVPIRYFFEIPNDSLWQEQYYLTNIQAFNAWDEFNPKDTVVVGVVDTGVDYLHRDLDEVIFVNPGESGKDQFGNDKRSNFIDDDNNGYIDDWRGWDFVSSDTSGMDNDPYPGHKHGTHVSGIIAAEINNSFGIAGICPTVKIMPVKVGGDSEGSRTIFHGYEAIIYAAENGADIINCSWGGPGYSETESEIIKAVVDLGVLVVGAAGNDGDETNFYPASYDNVLSVTSVNQYDLISGFSNYSTTVDVSAPGSNIMSTIPDNEFEFLDGTSMASPVAAGVAALIKAEHPEYSVKELIEHIKVTSDDIDDLQADYLIGKTGMGRVNAMNAVTAENLKSMITKDIIIHDENANKIYEPGERISISLNIENILDPVNNVRIISLVDSEFEFYFTKDIIEIASMQKSEDIEFIDAFVFTIPESIPLNYQFNIKLEINGDGFESRSYVTMTANPSYRTMDGNDISATFNESGNIAFNDYPDNNQGIGFRYLNSKSLLYEGALLVATAPYKISNVARGSDQMEKDVSFFANSPFEILNEGVNPAMHGVSSFEDNIYMDDAGVEVTQNVYQYSESGLENMLFITYDVKNIGFQDTDSLFAALFFDWDIGPGGSSNQVRYIYNSGLGLCENVINDTLPKVGVMLLNKRDVNFFAIDNDGMGGENPGIYDGFDTDEKWNMMSSGIARDESSVTDIAMVIGGGPNRLPTGESMRYAFCIIAGMTTDEILKSSETAVEKALEFGLIEERNEILPKTFHVNEPYPNPSNGEPITLEIKLGEDYVISIDFVDNLGRKLLEVANGQQYSPGIHTFRIEEFSISQGAYFLNIHLKRYDSVQTVTKPIIIIK